MTRYEILGVHVEDSCCINYNSIIIVKKSVLLLSSLFINSCKCK